MDIATSCCATIPLRLTEGTDPRGTRNLLPRGRSLAGSDVGLFATRIRCFWTGTLQVRGALLTRSPRCTDPRGAQTSTLKTRGPLTRQIQRMGAWNTMVGDRSTSAVNFDSARTCWHSGMFLEDYWRPHGYSSPEASVSQTSLGMC